MSEAELRSILYGDTARRGVEVKVEDGVVYTRKRGY
jgi:hypothetical protein